MALLRALSLGFPHTAPGSGGHLVAGLCPAVLSPRRALSFQTCSCFGLCLDLPASDICKNTATNKSLHFLLKVRAEGRKICSQKFPFLFNSIFACREVRYMVDGTRFYLFFF